MTLKKIHLELARTPQFPTGNPACGYEFKAPLDADGRLDAGEWSKVKTACTVRRFWQRADDEHGQLQHHRNRWVFSYRPGDDDDEAIFRFDTHAFKVGEYVSVTEHDGITRPFKVVAVEPIR
jgi:hypothetical protein